MLVTHEEGLKVALRHCLNLKAAFTTRASSESIALGYRTVSLLDQNFGSKHALTSEIQDN